MSKLYSLQVEKHSLAGLMRNPEVFADVDRFVSDKDYYSDTHQTIFNCIKNGILANEKLDKVLLAQKIKNLGISFKSDINIFEYIDSLAFIPVSPEGTISAFKELAKFRVLRDLSENSDKIKSHIEKNVSEPLEKIISEIDSIYGKPIDLLSNQNTEENLFASLLDMAEERGNNPQNESGFATPFPEFNRLYGGFRKKNLYIVASRAKSGKALEENTPIPTPNGFTLIKDLKVGDEVFSLSGKITKVKAIAKWSNRNLYKATTCDGQSVVCDEGHDWTVQKRTDYEWEVLDTKSLYAYNILQSGNKRPQTPSLPRSGSLDLPDKVLPIDPYILGLWLGDGTSKCAELTTADQFILDKWTEYASNNNLKVTNPKKYSYRLSNNRNGNTFLTALRKNNLFGNKHIPSEYLRASTPQREKLLQGLIDSDGHICPKKGRVEFCNKNEILSYQVLELIHSLGIKASIHKNDSYLYDKLCAPRYRIAFFSEEAALLPRKRANSLVRREKYSNRHIKVEPCGVGNTVCIEVEDSSHIFLCGKAMIPTHNSTILNHIASEMSKNHKMPVLFLDTEMSTQETQFRTIAAKTGVPLWYVETGNWRKNASMVAKIRNTLKDVSQYNVFHRFIGNKKLEEVISIARRWRLKHAGRDGNCMIVFDYIKAIDKLTGNQQEYQLMGDKVDAIKKLSEELDCPILTAVQNNRSGITTNKSVTDIVDDESSVGISDRITWYASGVWILRRRVEEEIVLDTPESGTHKLIELVCRYQGRDAAGHQDLIRRTFPDGKTKYVKNFINIDIQNFNVEERGSLRDTIARQNAVFQIEDPNGRNRAESETL